MKSTARIIAEGVPALLRALERARVDCSLAAITGHIQASDGEVLITVRADGTASASFEERVEDITPMLGPSLRYER